MAFRSLVTAVSIYPSLTSATHVTIRIPNISQADGIVWVAICREVEWTRHDCSFGGHTIAIRGVVEVSIEVPPGVYGVLVHHDVNGNGRVDTNIVGIPVEGVGFSKDASVTLGFPSFASVCLPITGDTASETVTLRFEPRHMRK